MTDNGIVLQIVTVLLALLVVVALARIYAAAVLPVLRNRRLARRGVSDEPAYRRERGNIFHLLFQIVPAVAVVGILAAIAIPAYQDYTNRAQSAVRDQQRVASLALIQNALDTYYLDHGAYPVSDSESLDAAGFAAALDALVTGGYLASLPNDPSGDPVTYVYQSTANGTYYCLGANTEGVPPPSTCDTTTLGIAFDANYAVGP
jgi:type II secretory pathway pseudopilin PulG